MTRHQKKLRLRKVLREFEKPIHCAGCDEWMCGGVEESGAFHAVTAAEVEAVLKEIESWEAKEPTHED